MAQITVLGYPNIRDQVEARQINQLSNTLEQIVKQLNTTFTNNIPEENAEQMGWFLK
tara:strand:+ start:2511 stop:2681 length:171 start_codon:yes stop_codon:yes gene_type:complete